MHSLSAGRFRILARISPAAIRRPRFRGHRGFFLLPEVSFQTHPSFTFFLISVSCFALLYVSHFGALISYREVVKHLISEDEDPEEAESGAQSEAELINE